MQKPLSCGGRGRAAEHPEARGQGETMTVQPHALPIAPGRRASAKSGRGRSNCCTAIVPSIAIAVPRIKVIGGQRPRRGCPYFRRGNQAASLPLRTRVRDRISLDGRGTLWLARAALRRACRRCLCMRPLALFYCPKSHPFRPDRS